MLHSTLCFRLAIVVFPPEMVRAVHTQSATIRNPSIRVLSSINARTRPAETGPGIADSPHAAEWIGGQGSPHLTLRHPLHLSLRLASMCLSGSSASLVGTICGIRHRMDEGGRLLRHSRMRREITKSLEEDGGYLTHITPDLGSVGP